MLAPRETSPDSSAPGGPGAPARELTGPIPEKLAISLFSAPAATSTKPTRIEVAPADLVRMLTTHERRRDKDGAGWSGATYRPGTTRANANVVEWSVSAGDFDHLSIDECLDLRERLAGFGLAFILYSTFQSTETDLRFRVVLFLTKPVPAERYGDVWRRINASIFGGKNDPNTKDASRMLYTPAAPEGVATVGEHHPGLALNWKALPPAPVLGPAVDGGVSRGAVDYLGYKTLDFVANGAPIRTQRARALAAARGYLAAGYSIEDTAAAVWRGMQACMSGPDNHDPADPWTYEHALDLARDMAKREPSPLPGSEDLLVVTAVGGTNGTSEHAEGSALSARQTTRRAFRWTDTGNAERLVHRHGADLRYCYPWGTWLVYDGRRFTRDDTGEARRRAKEAVRSMYADAAAIEDDAKRDALVKWARASESADKISAMLKQAQSEPGIPIVPEEMDADPHLLNVLNGTIDLRTGELRPHDRRDRITKLAPVDYDPSAGCPAFLAFLERVLPDEAVRRFLQRFTGHSLTGDTSEQCLCFLHGGGANGKSTLLTVLQAVLGDYAKQAAPELLTHKAADRHPTELADLFGARLVTSVEVDEGKRLAETLIKQMTGGDRMKARFMRGDFFEWAPTHKLFLAANHRPEVRGTDYAIWRRIHLVPFTVTIPKEERDRRLPARLLAEAPGILAWAIRGCLEWRRDGLGVPAAVEEATSAYRVEQDILATFLAERCILDPRGWVLASALFGAYKAWCEECGERWVSQKALGLRLAERGLSQDRRGKNRARAWVGLRLRGLDEPTGGRVAEADASGRDFPHSSSPMSREGDIPKNASNASAKPNASAWRCPSCGSYEGRRELPRGFWKCQDCGHLPASCSRCHRAPAVEMGECASCLGVGT
jgi:putative DNA primase/helicase